MDYIGAATIRMVDLAAWHIFKSAIFDHHVCVHARKFIEGFYILQSPTGVKKIPN